MRFENWDVILFPRDSHVPIQEFKTAFYVVQDDYGLQLPTLTCYIASLNAHTPFRISLHSWTKPKPTPLIESKRKSQQRVVYIVRVMIDGTSVFQEILEPGMRWPHEIDFENLPPTLASHHARQHHHQSGKPTLQFPPFRRNILQQSSWDVRENTGRIKVFLSEQLVSKQNSPIEEMGSGNYVACFAFQHAPTEILEQAGISWPLRNPLYLPSACNSRSHTPGPSRSHTPTSYPSQRNSAPATRAPSPSSRHAESRAPQSGRGSSSLEKQLRPASRIDPFSNPGSSQFLGPDNMERGRRGQHVMWDDNTYVGRTDSPTAFANGPDSGFGELFDNTFNDFDVSMVEDWSNTMSASQYMNEHSLAGPLVPDLILASPSEMEGYSKQQEVGTELGIEGGEDKEEMRGRAKQSSRQRDSMSDDRTKENIPPITRFRESQPSPAMSIRSPKRRKKEPDVRSQEEVGSRGFSAELQTDKPSQTSQLRAHSRSHTLRNDGGAGSLSTRPSAAALARTANYNEYNTTSGSSNLGGTMGMGYQQGHDQVKGLFYGHAYHNQHQRGPMIQLGPRLISSRAPHHGHGHHAHDPFNETGGYPASMTARPAGRTPLWLRFHEENARRGLTSTTPRLGEYGIDYEDRRQRKDGPRGKEHRRTIQFNESEMMDPSQDADVSFIQRTCRIRKEVDVSHDEEGSHYPRLRGGNENTMALSESYQHTLENRIQPSQMQERNPRMSASTSHQGYEQDEALVLMYLREMRAQGVERDEEADADEKAETDAIQIIDETGTSGFEELQSQPQLQIEPEMEANKESTAAEIEVVELDPDPDIELDEHKISESKASPTHVSPQHPGNSGDAEQTTSTTTSLSATEQSSSNPSLSSLESRLWDALGSELNLVPTADMGVGGVGGTGGERKRKRDRRDGEEDVGRGEVMGTSLD